MTGPTTDCKLPTFSIVTPSFNHGMFIELSLRSVLEQDYPENKVQYIVMDGGSKDETVDILRQYQANLSHWQSQSDDGQASAVNNGMKMADGDIVAWLNSDDIYLPGVLREVAEVMADSRVQATSGNAYHWDVKNQQLYSVKGAPPIAWLLRLYQNYVAQPTCFWRRDIWRTFDGLRPSLQRCLDYEFHLRLLETGVKYKYVNKERAVILWHGGNKCALLDPSEELRVISRNHRLIPKSVRRWVGKPTWTALQIQCGNHRWVGGSISQRIRRLGRPGVLGLKIDREGCEARLGRALRTRLCELTDFPFQK